MEIGMIPWWALPVAGGILGATIIFLWLTFRCRHAWELVDKTEFTPPVNDMRPGTTYWTSDLRWMHRRTLILVVRCTSSCKRVKVIREENC